MNSNNLKHIYKCSIYTIAPGCVEGQGAYFIVLLDAVDGELAGGGGSANKNGVIDYHHHGDRHDGAEYKGYRPAAQDNTFHNISPPKNRTRCYETICQRDKKHVYGTRLRGDVTSKRRAQG